MLFGPAANESAYLLRWQTCADRIRHSIRAGCPLRTFSLSKRKETADENREFEQPQKCVKGFASPDLKTLAHCFHLPAGAIPKTLCI